MSVITVYQVAGTAIGPRIGKTDRAYEIIETKELMRGWTLQFTIVNNDSIRKLIGPGVTFEVGGQYFDCSGYESRSGQNNTTIVRAVHISYRLNLNYMSAFGPPGYMDGSTKQLLDFLISPPWQIGEYVDTGNYRMSTTGTYSVRASLMQFGSIGLEVDFDNFTVHLLFQVGRQMIPGYVPKVFEFGKDLVNFTRTWEQYVGTTYQIDAAVLHRLPGGESEIFGVGDLVIVRDAYIGDEIEQRIIRYEKCHDNPTLDRITLGDYEWDNAATQEILWPVPPVVIGEGS